VRLMRKMNFEATLSQLCVILRKKSRRRYVCADEVIE